MAREEILSLAEDDLYTVMNARRLLLHFMAAREPVTFEELLEGFVGNEWQRRVYRELPEALEELYSRLDGMLPIADLPGDRGQARDIQDAVLRLYGDRIVYTVDQLRRTRVVQD